MRKEHAIVIWGDPRFYIFGSMGGFSLLCLLSWGFLFHSFESNYLAGICSDRCLERSGLALAILGSGRIHLSDSRVPCTGYSIIQLISLRTTRTFNQKHLWNGDVTRDENATKVSGADDVS